MNDTLTTVYLCVCLHQKFDKISGDRKTAPGKAGENMAEQHRTYDYRLQHLENNLVNHDGKLDKFDARNDTHSAKLKMMERELQEIKAENEALFDEVVSMRYRGLKNKIEDEMKNETYRSQYRQEGEADAKYRNVDTQTPTQETFDDRLKLDFRQDQENFDRDYHDEDYPDTSRSKGYYRFKSIPYQNRMLLNDNYNQNQQNISPRHGEAQRKKEYDKITMHEGNFKPYASDSYYQHLMNRNPVSNRTAACKTNTYLSFLPICFYFLIVFLRL